MSWIEKRELMMTTTMREIMERAMHATLDWGNLESEVRDLMTLIRRKDLNGVMEAMGRIDEMLLQHMDAQADTSGRRP